MSRRTGLGTSTTVCIIGFEVYAFAVTLRETALARELALTVRADLTGRTANSAFTTVGKVRFEVYANIAAFGESRLARDLTFTAGTNLTC